MTAAPQTPGNIPHTTDSSGQVRRFLAECTVSALDDTDVLPVADLYGMYIIWCEQTQTQCLAVQTFSALMRAEGIISGIRHRQKVFTGVIATGPIPIQYILETDKGPGPHSPLGTLPF